MPDRDSLRKSKPEQKQLWALPKTQWGKYLIFLVETQDFGPNLKLAKDSWGCRKFLSGSWVFCTLCKIPVHRFPVERTAKIWNGLGWSRPWGSSSSICHEQGCLLLDQSSIWPALKKLPVLENHDVKSQSLYDFPSCWSINAQCETPKDVFSL